MKMTTSPTDVLGIGIIGAGIMGANHAASLAGDRRARLVGVAGLPLQTAEALASRYGAEFATEDYRRVIDHPGVSLITVATPDHLHREICLAAAEAGKHVMVEKPLTTSLDEADAIVEAIEASGITVMVCFNHRWIPSYAQAHAEIVAGRIGRPVMAFARKNDRIYVPTQMLSWASSTTSAWFLSSHDIDLVTWFMGARPTQVYATAIRGVLEARGIDTPDGIQAQVRYEGGGVATFESCWIYPDTFPTMTDSFIEVIGQEGVIHIPREHDQLKISSRDGYAFPRISVAVDVHGQRQGAVTAALSHMVTCVLEQRQPLISLQSSRDVIAVLDAMHRSLNSDQPEAVR